MLPSVIVEYLEDGKVIVIVALVGIFVTGINSMLYSAVSEISVGVAVIAISKHNILEKQRNIIII